MRRSGNRSRASAPLYSDTSSSDSDEELSGNDDYNSTDPYDGRNEGGVVTRLRPRSARRNVVYRDVDSEIEDFLDNEDEDDETPGTSRGSSFQRGVIETPSLVVYNTIERFLAVRKRIMSPSEWQNGRYVGPPKICQSDEHSSSSPLPQLLEEKVQSEANMNTSEITEDLPTAAAVTTEETANEPEATMARSSVDAPPSDPDAAKKEVQSTDEATATFENYASPEIVDNSKKNFAPPVVKEKPPPSPAASTGSQVPIWETKGKPSTFCLTTSAAAINKLSLPEYVKKVEANNWEISEYLVKYHNVSYLHAEWLHEVEVQEAIALDRPLRTRYGNFLKKLDQRQPIAESELLAAIPERVVDCSDVFRALYPTKAAEIVTRADSWAAVSLKIIDTLVCFVREYRAYGVPFLRPVEEDYDGAPGYYEVVTKPMDFSTIQTKLYLGQYASPDDFWRDTKLIFHNCAQYNAPNTDISIQCRALEALFDKVYLEWSLETEKGSGTMKIGPNINTEFNASSQGDSGRSSDNTNNPDSVQSTADTEMTKGDRITEQTTSGELALPDSAGPVENHSLAPAGSTGTVGNLTMAPPDSAAAVEGAKGSESPTGTATMVDDAPDDETSYVDLRNGDASLTLKKIVRHINFNDHVRDSSRQILYLVKWKNRSYSEMSWERSEDISDKMKIAQYHRHVRVPEYVVDVQGPGLYEQELQRRMLQETLLHVKAARDYLLGHSVINVHALPPLSGGSNAVPHRKERWSYSDNSRRVASAATLANAAADREASQLAATATAAAALARSSGMKFRGAFNPAGAMFGGYNPYAGFGLPWAGDLYGAANPAAAALAAMNAAMFQQQQQQQGPQAPIGQVSPLESLAAGNAAAQRLVSTATSNPDPNRLGYRPPAYNPYLLAAAMQQNPLLMRQLMQQRSHQQQQYAAQYMAYQQQQQQIQMRNGTAGDFNSDLVSGVSNPTGAATAMPAGMNHAANTMQPSVPGRDYNTAPGSVPPAPPVTSPYPTPLAQSAQSQPGANCEGGESLCQKRKRNTFCPSLSSTHKRIRKIEYVQCTAVLTPPSISQLIENGLPPKLIARTHTSDALLAPGGHRLDGFLPPARRTISSAKGEDQKPFSRARGRFCEGGQQITEGPDELNHMSVNNAAGVVTVGDSSVGNAMSSSSGNNDTQVTAASRILNSSFSSSDGGTSNVEAVNSMSGDVSRSSNGEGLLAPGAKTSDAALSNVNTGHGQASAVPSTGALSEMGNTPSNAASNTASSAPSDAASDGLSEAPTSLPAAKVEDGDPLKPVIEKPLDRTQLASFAATSVYAQRFADMKKPKAPPPGVSRTYLASPVYKGGRKLFDYQLEGLNWVLQLWEKGVNGILADEMGLGKTVQSISVLWHFFTKEKMRGPFLVVAPLSTLDHWKRTAEDWTDFNVVLYYDENGKAGRDALRRVEWFYHMLQWDNKKGSSTGNTATAAQSGGTTSGAATSPCKIVSTYHYKFQLLLTSYEIFASDAEILLPIPWQFVIVDEAHRLKNRLSKTLQLLKQVACRHTLLLTGTPVQNNTEELWPLLNYIEPVRFCDVDLFKAEFGELQTQTQVERLSNLLRPHLLRRVKEDVAESIPPLEETIIDVELTILQKAYYKAIFEKNKNFLFKNAKRGQPLPSLMNVEMELRKCCNHPFMVPGVAEREFALCRTEEEQYRKLIESSGKFVLLSKLLPKLKAEGHKVLIFSQFQQTLTLIQDFLQYNNWEFERLDGQVKGCDRSAGISRFNDLSLDKFVFLLSTRAGGIGINLTSADTVIIFDSDWNPQNDVQATARAHRIGQLNEVKVYRLITARTYEADMFERAAKKLGLNTAVFHRGAFDAKGAAPLGNTKGPSKDEVEDLLKKGAFYLLEKGGGDVARQFQEGDIEEILTRNSRLVRYQMSGTSATFAKTSFRSDKASDLSFDDPDFWLKVLNDSSSRRLLARLNDGTATESPQAMNEFMEDLRAAVEGIAAEDDPEPVIEALVQMSNLTTFSEEHRALGEKLLSRVNAALDAVGSTRGNSVAADRDRHAFGNEEVSDGEGNRVRRSVRSKVDTGALSPEDRGDWEESERRKARRMRRSEAADSDAGASDDDGNNSSRSDLEAFQKRLANRLAQGDGVVYTSLNDVLRDAESLSEQEEDDDDDDDDDLRTSRRRGRGSARGRGGLRGTRRRGGRRRVMTAAVDGTVQAVDPETLAAALEAGVSLESIGVPAKRGRKPKTTAAAPRRKRRKLGEDGGSVLGSSDNQAGGEGLPAPRPGPGRPRGRGDGARRGTRGRPRVLDAPPPVLDFVLEP